MGKNKGIYKCLALISQFGINIIVPTFLCLFVGILLGKLVGEWIVIPFLLLGMAAGMRNCYVMAMSVIGSDEKKEVNNHDGREKDH